MFFVGATGQLITLILTVCLPFVFMVSYQPKTELPKEKLLIENHKNHEEVPSLAISPFDLIFDGPEILQNTGTGFEGSFVQKIPHQKFKVKWKSFYADSSGNKAPPCFSCFSC